MLKVPPIVKKAFKAALKAQKLAYAPYSNYSVGAALISHRKKIFSGANVENASFGGTVCAERIAIFKAANDGHRCLEHIVVVTQDKNPASPCGLCLQVMAEFFGPDAKVWLANPKGIMKVLNFSEFLPRPFGPRTFTTK